GPLAFYGHSLGALIALDLARATSERTVQLFCAARPWPGAPASDRSFLLDSEPANFEKRMEKAYGAAPPSFANPEIRDYALPILMADLQLMNSYAYGGPAALACPLTVFAGADDPVTQRSDPMLWGRETTGPIDVVTFDAGHYFLESHRDRLGAAISERLDAASPPL
ncbi:MAG: alpha/beta fold hydrolase, partial [Parvularculaceae bacterium]